METCNRHDEVIKMLEDHEDRIDTLEKGQISVTKDIQMLCGKLKDLTDAIKWLIGIAGSGLVGFFFYVIQQTVVK